MRERAIFYEASHETEHNGSLPKVSEEMVRMWVVWVVIAFTVLYPAAILAILYRWDKSQ